MKKNLLSTALIALTALFFMPQSVWADDPQQLSGTAVTALDFASETTDNSSGLTAITNYNNTGFYLRGSSTSGLAIPVRVPGKDSRTFNFSDGTSVTRQNFALLKRQNKNSYSGKTANGTVEEASRLNIGFQTPCAGTVYIAFQKNSSTTSSTGGLFRLAFDGSIVASATLTEVASKTNRCDILEYTATSGGTFFIDAYGSGDNTNDDVNVYYVKFVPAYSLTLNTADNGSVSAAIGETSVTSGSNVAIGKTVTLNITPDDGYKLKSLTVKDGSNNDVSKTTVTSGIKYTFTMPTSAATVTATFEKIKYALTSSATNGNVVMKKGNDSGSEISSGVETEWGTNVYVSATPTSDSYYLSSLTYGGTSMSNNSTFEMPKSATEVVATFAEKTTPTYTAPTYSALTYNGSAQNLVTAGSTEHGTIKYATTSGGEFITTIPIGTDAGSYIVWYKVEGDASHTDIAATEITGVSIAKYDITNATIDGTIADQTHTGSALTPTAPAIKMGDTTIDVSNYDISYSNNTDVGIATVTYTAKEGSTNFTGTKALNFNIVAAAATNPEPSSLDADDISFAGLAVNNVEVSNTSLFTVNETNKTFSTNSTSASSIYAKGAIFTYSRNDGVFTLGTNYLMSNNPLCSIKIPGLTAGQTVFARICGQGGDNLSFTASEGTIVTDATSTSFIKEASEYGKANDLFFTASGTSVTITSSGRGFRLFRIALAQKLTTSISGPTSTEATISVSPSVSATAAVTDANLGNGYFVKGTKVTVTAPDITDYTFIGWLDGTTTVSTDKAYTFNINSDVSLTAVYKQSGNISFAETEVAKTTSDAAFTNTLTITGDGSVSYESSNTGVATINGEGLVSIVAAGTTTITATVTDGTNYTYTTNTATYTLTVTEAVTNYTLTITQPENTETVGSISASPSGTVASGTEITLTATPNSGYQLKRWKNVEEALGSLPQSLVQTISMPSSNLTVTAEFEAVATTAPSITTATTWTFDDFAAGTALSYNERIYLYNGLYISGHNDSNLSNMATVKAATSAVSTTVPGISSVNNYLYLAGSLNSGTMPSANSKASNFYRDCAAFYAGCAGTVYVYISGTKDSSRHFVVNVNGTSNTTAMSGENTNPVLISQSVPANSNVYIGTDNGACNIYAIKFVPTHKVTTATNPTGKATVTIQKGTTDVTSETEVEEGASLTVTVSEIASGYEVSKVEMNSTDITSTLSNGKYSFTMPETTEDVTVTVTLTSTSTPSTTAWTFPTSGQVEVVTAHTQNEVATGLYYRAGAATGRHIAFGDGVAYTWTFGDEHAITTTTSTGCATLLANNSLAPTCESASSGLGTALTGDADNRALAYTSSVPGTFYVAFRAKENNNTDRAYKLFFKPEGGSAYTLVTSAGSNTVSTAENRKGALYYAAPVAGTFVFGGGTDSYVYAVEFVAATTAKTLTATVSPENSGTISKKIGEDDIASSVTSFAQNTTVTLTATPATDKEFVKWTAGSAEGAALTTGDDYTVVGAEIQVKMSADKTVMAVFQEATATQYQLTITQPINGKIKVGDTEASTADYDENTEITLTAVADDADAYEFESWTVDGTAVTAANDNNIIAISGNSITVKMTKAFTLSATFKAKSTTPTTPWTINYAQTAVSKVTYGSGTTAERTTTTSYAIGETATYPFHVGDYLADHELMISRSDGILRYADVKNIGLFNNNKNVYGIQNLKAGDVIEIAYNGGGDSNGMKTVPELADLVNVTESSETGTYTFKFNYNNVDRTLDYTVKRLTVTADGAAGFALTAGYIAKISVGTTYTVNASVSPEATGTVSVTSPAYMLLGDGFASGTDVTLKAEPASGYEFKEWKNGDTQVSTEASYTITNLSENTSLTAVFEQSTVNYTMKVVAGENGSVKVEKGDDDVTAAVTAEDGAEYLTGTSLKLTATPVNGYEFVNWTNGTTEVSTDNPYTVSLTESMTLTANFQESTIPAEETVSEETTWTFNGYTTTDVVSTCAEAAQKPQTDKLYNRSATSGRGFTFVELATAENISFTGGDQTAIPISKVATSSGNFNNTSMNAYTAGSAGNNTTPFFAFNTTVAGTCYAYVKSYEYTKSDNTKDKGNIRIYFGKGDGTDIAGGTGYATTNSTDGAEIKLTATSAGTFFIGGVTNNAQRDIYAIRFVPTPIVEKHDVNVPTGVTNGSISANVSEAAEGETVTLTVSPNEGYMVDAITVKDASNSSVDVTTVTENSSYTFEMPASNVTVTVTFKVIPTIYGTYDFRSFANSNLTAGTTASIGKTDANVMTGSFTGITNTMTLNDAFGIKFDTDAREIKLARGEDDASTGIAIPRGSADQVAFYLYGLKSGEWFKLGTGDIPLYINKVNNTATISFYDLDDPDKTNVARNAEIVSGHTYVASGDISSMEFCYNTSNSGNIYLYTAQISNGDAVPAPTIGSYDFATGKVGITVHNSLKGQTPTVYYTTNGDEPTTSSTVYSDTEKITLSEATTIKAIAVYGEIKSTVAEKLVILESVDAPTIGDYDTSAKTVAITTGNSTNTDATLTTYYTLDGSTPSASSTKYTEAIAIDQTRIVKAVTISSTGVASDVTTKKITVSDATPATTWDFTTMSALQYGDDATTVYYNGGSGSNFNYIVGSDIHAKMSSQAGDGALSISADKYLTGTKPFAIHDLAVGDKVYITYTGGQLKLFRGTKGNSLTIGETTISVSGDYNFDSGAEIAVTAVDADDNYIALRQATATAKITKIEINPVYQVTKGTVGSNISSLTMTSPSGKTFGDSFARGTEVTLKATTTATGGNFLWTDGDGNTLTPSTDDTSVLTLTLTDNITVNVSYSNATIWDFSELTAGDITTVKASNGMYYRAGARTTDGKQGRAIVVGENTSQLTWNFPDGTVYSRQNSSANTAPYVTLPGNTTLAPASSAAPSDKEGQTLTSDDDSNNRSLAFTTTSAGTVYVAYRVASGRYANLYFKPTSGDSYSIVSTDGADDNNNRQGMLFYTAPSGGTFFIGGTGDMNVYMVKFEPASTDIYTLTETANPTAGGSVKKEIIYGDESSPSYYEAVANTFLPNTKLRLTPAPNVGYGFSSWGDNTTDATKTITMNADQSVKVNFGEVKRTVTVASAENGSVSLRVGDSAVELTDGSAQVGDGAEVTVMTTPTLFYGVSDISVTKTGDPETTIEVTNGKFTLPEYDVTVTVTFAEENKCYSEKTWTFETTDLSETITTVKYFKDGLYLRGSSGSKAITQVDAAVTSVTLNGEAITVSKALKTAATFDAPDAANNSATAVSPLKATSGTAMLALNTAVKGTLYVAMSPVSDESGEARVYFYDGTNEPTAVKAKTEFSSSSEVYTVSYETAVPGIFFVGGTKAVNIYAAKFVPADTSGDIKITKMSESGNIYQLSNGLLTVTIGSEGYVDQIKMADGTEIMQEGGTHENGWGYFSYNTSSSDSRRLFKDGENYPTVNIVTQTSDMVEIVYTNSNNSLAQTWSVGYIMRKGVSGIYTYAKVKNGSTESYLPEARFVWRPDRDNFNYGYVSDDRQGEAAIPSYSKFSGATSLQDATYKFSDGTIYTKYDWANFVKDDQVHGVMSSKNGIWVITPSYEWINGGVQKQDLMVHADDGGPVLLQMMQSQHFGAASHTLAASEEKFFGPALLYLNSGSSKDAMISDAKTMAESEVNAWPYTWFTNDDYPQASDRSKVTGTITLSNTDFKTTKIRVILADNSVDDPLVQSGGYQYDTEVESTTGSYAFTIPNVRPGTYALFAYALNGDATGVLKTSRTYTMPTNRGMGTIVWEPKKYGETLWQIGEADHSTSGFKDSDHARQYGLWDNAPTSLTYTVGTSSASDWYYVQPKGSTWSVNFDCTESFSDPLRLTIAVAGASRKPTLVVKMNDHQVHNAQYTNDDPSVYRSATLSGQYGLIEIEIPANNMVVGTNTLTIAANSGSSDVVGLMYDCIKLESPKTRFVVSEAKTWVFGELETGTQYKAITPVNEEYYLRTGAAVTGTSTASRTFTVTDATSSPTFTFADGTSVSTNTGKYLAANGAYKAGDNPIAATSSAGSNEGYSYPMFAFNISEAGSVYAKVKGTSGDKFRIYFANGSSIVNKEYEATGDIDEISYTTSEAGSIFITDVTSKFEIHAVRFSPTSTATKYDLTVGSPENGTITATVAGTAYDEGTTNGVVPATEVTLTATPAEGYQLKGWTDGSGGAIGAIPQSIVTTTDMPKEALTVTATFEALPTLEGVTSSTTWTFSDFTTGTALSDAVVYGYNNGTGTLYIGGHGNANAANMATVKAGSASGTLGSTTINATSYLALAGGLSSESLKTDRTPNTYTKDAIGFYAGAAGTIYVLMQGAYAEGRTFNIYVNGTRYTKDMPEDNAVTVVSQEIDAAANVFIATSAGEAKIYAVKFVAADESNVTYQDNGDGTATVVAIDIPEEAIEVTISATDEEGNQVTDIAGDVFTAENTENVAAIDLSETAVTMSGNRESIDALKNINSETLIYLPATANVTGTNVVTKSGTGETATFSCTDYEVTDGRNVAVPHSFTADEATLNRTFIADKKCTVCLPYDFTATGGTFYMFTGISNGKVQMTAQTDGSTLKANTPYIFVPSKNESSISAQNVEVSISKTPQTANAEANYTFKGTFTNMTWTSPSGIYGFAAEADGLAAVGQFVHVGSGASILACRAYLEYTGSGSLNDVAATRGASSVLPALLEIEWLTAKTRGATWTRGIKEQADGDEPTYNMNGQRVDSSYKGLVIINGKKVVRK